MGWLKKTGFFQPCLAVHGAAAPLLPLLHTVLEGAVEDLGNEARQAGNLAGSGALVGLGLHHRGVRVLQQGAGNRQH